MTREKFKVIVEKINSIYFSHDWIPEGNVTATVFQEENEMPFSLRLRVIELIDDLEEAV